MAARRRRQVAHVEEWKCLGAVLAVAVALAGGGKVTFDRWPRPVPAVSSNAPTGSTGPASSTSGAALEAAQVNSLLRSIRASRMSLPSSLGNCGSVESDVIPLTQVIEERRAQATTAADLRTDELPNGPELKSALVAMTRDVLDADEKYLTWAQNAQTAVTCGDAGGDPAINAANQAAADAKRGFVQLWNPIAAQLGQPAYSWNDF